MKKITQKHIMIKLLQTINKDNVLKGIREKAIQKKKDNNDRFLIRKKKNAN